jgi:hypothetical protein
MTLIRNEEAGAIDHALRKLKEAEEVKDVRLVTQVSSVIGFSPRMALQ